HLYIIFFLLHFLAVETQYITIITLSYISHLKTFNPFLFKKLYRKQIENMFYILNTVHMTININIAISGLVFRNRSFLCHLNTTGLAYRTFLIAYIINDTTSVKRKQVSRFASFHTDHRPYRTGVSDSLS